MFLYVITHSFLYFLFVLKMYELKLCLNLVLNILQRRNWDKIKQTCLVILLRSTSLHPVGNYYYYPQLLCSGLHCKLTAFVYPPPDLHHSEYSHTPLCWCLQGQNSLQGKEYWNDKKWISSLYEIFSYLLISEKFSVDSVNLRICFVVNKHSSIIFDCQLTFLNLVLFSVLHHLAVLGQYRTKPRRI